MTNDTNTVSVAEELMKIHDILAANSQELDGHFVVVVDKYFWELA